MRKKFLFAVCCLLTLLFAFTACGGEPPAVSDGTDSTPPVHSEPPEESETAPSDEPVDPTVQQLNALTTEEKVGQLLVAGINGYEAGEDAMAAIQTYRVGGIILFKRNVESAAQLTALTNALKELNGEQIPLLLSVDEEGGMVSRMPEELTDLPSAWSYRNAGEEACFRRGSALGAQCAAFGFSMDFAPVMDVWSNPANTVIGKRAFGDDPDTVARLANQTALGLMSEGVIPVAKHFPGHGDTDTDSHYDLPVVNKTVEELWEEELLPFRTAIDETGIPAVMVAHILMTAIDEEYPASLSPAVVDGLLRGTMGFDGVVCTDDLTMGAVSDSWGMGEAAVLAVEAGCDLLLVCHGADKLAEAYGALLEAVNTGRISMERLDASVARILKLKAEYAVTNDPVEAADVSALNAIITQAKP